MISGVFKRLFWQWSCTLVALLLLLVIGILVSAWLSDVDLATRKAYSDARSLMLWRYLLFAILVGLWPRILRLLIGRGAYTARYVASRYPLILLIVGYETFIVHNVLSVLG